MNALSNQEQQTLQKRMEQRQMKDFMQMYSGLVDKCFNNCVEDFTSKTMTSKEDGCLSRCWDKNMKAQERLQMRFQEENEAMNAGMSQQ
ncbi:MAG: protein transporter tim9 [Alyxoria varia]|nr:MAG: protein transporter tim9 [Alyxoria varia]